MTEIKQAISPAKACAAELLGKFDVLLEEVSSDESVIRITLSFTARTVELRDEDKDSATWGRYHADSREYKEFIVDKRTGAVAISIRQIA